MLNININTIGKEGKGSNSLIDFIIPLSGEIWSNKKYVIPEGVNKSMLYQNCNRCGCDRCFVVVKSTAICKTCKHGYKIGL
jgi:hypothetical protein